MDLSGKQNLQGTKFLYLENTTVTSNVLLVCIGISLAKLLSSFDQTP